MKKILFVINTLGRAGAETALIELLNHLDVDEYEISLYVLLGQGEMISKVPQKIHVKNKKICTDSVLSSAGRQKMLLTSLAALFRNGHTGEKIAYIIKNLCVMKKTGKIQPDKLLWRVVSDGADRFDEKFDLAVAYLEGGSTYYVADHVNAKKKAAFVHIAYGDSGYTREMDRGCYEKMDVIYTVSKETRRHFLEFYPEARWYIIGEGAERKALEKQIAELGLQADFVLLGMKENPFPYYAQCDLYVHATRFEGKSIAIQEAQMLGCAVIASDCAGNREQMEDGVDGLLCPLTPGGIAEKIEELIDDPEKKNRLATAAKQKVNGQTEDIQRLLDLMK